MAFTAEDYTYMHRAIALAKKGTGRVHPNPLVGAVIVQEGIVIGEGYHQKAGTPHAEVHAVQSAKGQSLKGATVYVTLEPCSHYGRTPPCADLLIKEQVGRVVIGSSDPNPLVAGKGIERMEQSGIVVETGCLQAECDAINRPFFHYITQKMPYVVLKMAMSLDGKIATATGESQWITGEQARADGHALRNTYTGILVGIGTVLADNPTLTCRIEGGRNPQRIVVDSHLRIPLTAKILQDQQKNQTVVATLASSNTEKRSMLEKQGVQILLCGEKAGRVDLTDMLQKLAEQGIDSILLEGGGTLNDSMVQENLVQEVVCYIAPKLIGGKDAKTPLDGKGVDVLGKAMALQWESVERLGDDIKLTAVRKEG